MAPGLVLPETPLVLDTDVLTAWRYQKPNVKQAIDDYIARLKRPPALASTTVFEVRYGFENTAVERGGLDALTEQGLIETGRFIQSCIILPFDQTAAEIAGYIFPRLSEKQRKKHWRDLFIAATALAHGHGVVTMNQSDFELIANHLPPTYLLRLDVWKP